MLLFENFIDKGVDVYIKDLERPAFKNHRLANIENGFICLESPDNFDFIYVNLSQVTFIRLTSKK